MLACCAHPQTATVCSGESEWVVAVAPCLGKRPVARVGLFLDEVGDVVRDRTGVVEPGHVAGAVDEPQLSAG